MVQRRHWTVADREDGVQEIWLSLITRLPDLWYEPLRGEFLDWVAAVATHRLVDQDRYRRAHPAERLAAEVMEQLASREPDPAAQAERDQLTEVVRATLAELRAFVSERDYDAFMLRWIKGLSVWQVAERSGMTEGQVRSSSCRVMAKFRAMVARRVDAPWSGA